VERLNAYQMPALCRENVVVLTTLVPPEGFEPSTSRFRATRLSLAHSRRTYGAHVAAKQVGMQGFVSRSSHLAVWPYHSVRVASRCREVVWSTESSAR